MKTQEQILAHIKYVSEADFLGTQRSDLLEFLTFTNAKEFLKDGVTEETWSGVYKEPTRENAIKEMKEYMPFAWGKANDNRGISADRSIQHMLAYTFIADDGTYEKLKKSYEESYQYYGKPQLVTICDAYGIDWKSLDDNRWTNTESGGGITAESALAA